MNVLIGCEESQEITKRLRAKNINAYSCDIIDTSGPLPKYHLKMDVLEAIKIKKWDAALFFPPCTYLTVSANKWYKDQPPRKSGALVGAARRAAREQAVLFFLALYNCNIKKIAIENPIGIMSTRLKKPTQIIQPWQFGHGETKATCLWLKNFPALTPTKIMKERKQRLHLLSPSKDRAKIRSKTFPGIAEAITTQWF